MDEINKGSISNRLKKGLNSQTNHNRNMSFTSAGNVFGGR